MTLLDDFEFEHIFGPGCLYQCWEGEGVNQPTKEGFLVVFKLGIIFGDKWHYRYGTLL